MPAGILLRGLLLLQAPEVFRHEPYNSSVDVYSFSMILYQLFEHHPPFAGQDPVSACKAAAMENKRPQLQRLNDKEAVIQVGPSIPCSPA